MAMAKTASTNHPSTSTKQRNMMRARGVMVFDAMSAMERPCSRALATSAPKSCTAPMKSVPKTTHVRAGNQPQ